MPGNGGESNGMTNLRNFEAIAALGIAVLGAALLFSPALAKAPDAATIFARAEEVRSPDVAYAADFQIRVAPKRGKVQERVGSYSMVARGKDHTLVMMRSPKNFFGGSLLMNEAGYWLLLPKASKPLQLAEAQVLTGDVSYGDIARMNLVATYTPSLSGEEKVDGEPCYKLELAQTSPRAHYPRIVYWVAKKRFLPRKLEYHARTGDVAKIVRYQEYKKGRLGLRATGFVIDSTNETTTLAFSDLRPIETERVSFTPEGLTAFRDVAVARLAPDGPEVSLESLLALLPSKAP